MKRVYRELSIHFKQISRRGQIPENQLRVVVISNLFENRSLEKSDIVTRTEKVVVNELASETQDDNDELRKLEQFPEEVIRWTNWERTSLQKWDNRDYTTTNYTEFDDDRL